MMVAVAAAEPVPEEAGCVASAGTAPRQAPHRQAVTSRRARIGAKCSARPALLDVAPPAGATLDTLLARDQDLAYELGAEQPVLDDARGRAQPRGELAQLADRPQVVGDHSAVGAAGNAVAHARRLKLSERLPHAEAHELQRDRRRELAHELLRRDDDDEA